MGAIALALLLVIVGAYIYISGRESPAIVQDAVYEEEGPTDTPPAEHDHEHAE